MYEKTSRNSHFSFASLLGICSTKGPRHIYVNLCNLVKDFLFCRGLNLLDHPRLGLSHYFAPGHVFVRRRQHNGNEVSNQTSNQNALPPPIRMHHLLQSERTNSSNQNAPPSLLGGPERYQVTWPLLLTWPLLASIHP